MECLTAWLVFIGIFLAANILRQRGQQKWRRRQALVQLARRHGGIWFRGGWFRGAGVRLMYGETPCWIRIISSRRRGLRYQLVARWPDHRLLLLVQRRSRRAPAMRDRRLALYTTGSSRFDSRFEVWARDANEMQNFLRDGVCWQLDQLTGLPGPDDLQLSVRLGRLTVEKAIHSAHQYLDAFADLALELVGQALLSQAAGIEFVDASQAQVLSALPCPVCGETIQSDPVFCCRCKTAHHLECWQFTGKCAAYACPETRFAVPRVVQVAPPLHRPTS